MSDFAPIERPMIPAIVVSSRKTCLFKKNIQFKAHCIHMEQMKRVFIRLKLSMSSYEKMAFAEIVFEICLKLL